MDHDLAMAKLNLAGILFTKEEKLKLKNVKLITVCGIKMDAK